MMQFDFLTKLEVIMNTDTLLAKWEKLKGAVQKKWGQLTDDDMAKINGSYHELLGKIREKYGYEKEEAEKELKNFWKEHKLD